MVVIIFFCSPLSGQSQNLLSSAGVAWFRHSWKLTDSEIHIPSEWLIKYYDSGNVVAERKIQIKRRDDDDQQQEYDQIKSAKNEKNEHSLCGRPGNTFLIYFYFNLFTKSNKKSTFILSRVL
jgi:predicted adenine nucleotide alpha hydrolase (AANH) superfamily ATPase